MMKKSLAAFLILAQILCLSACGNSEPSAPEDVGAVSDKAPQTTETADGETVPESTEAAVSETAAEPKTEPVDDTQSAFYVIETNDFRATFSNLVFDGEDSCIYDVMIANLTDQVIELDSPEEVTLNPGESFLFKEYSWPITNTDKYGLSGIMFELYGYAEDDDLYGYYCMYYDHDTNEVLRTETYSDYDRPSAALVFEHSNELVRMEAYYYDRANINLIVTNISSYALYDADGEILEPGQSKIMYGYGDFKDDDTLVSYPSFVAYNASRIPVLSTAFEVLLNYKDLSLISSTERDNFIDLEQAMNTDVYRVNKYKRVNAEVVSTPYYTLTVKEIRAEGQEDGTILVTLTGELTNNYGMFYMLGTDVWKMGGELAYASGYPGYFGTESAQKITCSYTVSDEKDLGGTATFVMEGGWDPRSMAVLFGKETHSIHVEWTDFEPSFSK